MAEICWKWYDADCSDISACPFKVACSNPQPHLFNFFQINGDFDTRNWDIFRLLKWHVQNPRQNLCNLIEISEKKTLEIRKLDYHIFIKQYIAAVHKYCFQYLLANMRYTFAFFFTLDDTLVGKVTISASLT